MESKSSFLEWTPELSLGTDETDLSWNDYLRSPEGKLSSILAMSRPGHQLDDFDASSISDLEVFAPAARKIPAKQGLTKPAATTSTATAQSWRILNTQALAPAVQSLRAMTWAGWGNPFLLKLTKASVKRIGLPRYFEVVKTVMDLTRLQEAVSKGDYRSIDEFENDIRLITANSAQVNGPKHPVTDCAQRMVDEWIAKLKPLAVKAWTECSRRLGFEGTGASPPTPAALSGPVASSGGSAPMQL